MRIANLAGRATLIDDEGIGSDIEKSSNGRFPSDPQALFEQWDELREWASCGVTGDIAVGRDELGPPVPTPRQVFAIALNYAEHAKESKMERPQTPPVFTKFPSSIAGPNATVTLPSNSVDWEVELVVAIGPGGASIAEDQAWAHVAGLMVGQDLSERVVQLEGPVPQFSLGKSFQGFSPLGPSLVTVDEVDDPDDLELGCALDGEVLQNGRTSQMIFSVPELISRISAICPLLPGDIIFTGTPAGVGGTRTPPRFIPPGSTLTSYVRGVGELNNRFVAAPDYLERVW